MFGALAEGEAGRGERGEEFAQAAVEGDHFAGGGGDAEVDGREPGAVEEEEELNAAGFGTGADGGSGEAFDGRGQFIAGFEDLFDAEAAGVLTLGLFEVEVLGEAVAGGGGGFEERGALGGEEVDEAVGFGAVFVGGDGLLAGAEALHHLAVDAAGVVWSGREVFLAAADLEEVEEVVVELFGGGAGEEGPVVEGVGGGEAGGDGGAGEGIGEMDFEQDGGAEFEEGVVGLWEVEAGELIEEEGRGEAGGGEVVFDQGGGGGEGEKAGGGAGGEEAGEAAAEAGGAGEVGAGVGEMDEEDGGRVGDGGEIERRGEGRAGHILILAGAGEKKIRREIAASRHYFTTMRK